jgi:pimeloyl-ACP methyl ester carboxylesterase
MTSKSTTTDDPFSAPPRELWRREGPRAMLELGQFWAAFPRLAIGPPGDGHTVLVLPGFTATDNSTVPLRTLLTTRGYRAEPWQLGGNIGPSRRILDGMTERLRELAASSERKVSLIGWSLGGILARDLARRFPELVRQVISLGSPFLLDGRRGQQRHTHSERLYEALRPLHSRDFVRTRPAGNTQPPLPVPATAIYTRTDGVVPWRACLEPDSPTSENVAVEGSHCGLGHNPAAVRVILDRLALPDGTWHRYAAR